MASHCKLLSNINIFLLKTPFTNILLPNSFPISSSCPNIVAEIALLCNEFDIQITGIFSAVISIVFFSSSSSTGIIIIASAPLLISLCISFCCSWALFRSVNVTILISTSISTAACSNPCCKFTIASLLLSLVMTEIFV